MLNGYWDDLSNENRLFLLKVVDYKRNMFLLIKEAVGSSVNMKMFSKLLIKLFFNRF